MGKWRKGVTCGRKRTIRSYAIRKLRAVNKKTDTFASVKDGNPELCKASSKRRKQPEPQGEEGRAEDPTPSTSSAVDSATGCKEKQLKDVDSPAVESKSKPRASQRLKRTLRSRKVPVGGGVELPCKLCRLDGGRSSETAASATVLQGSPPPPAQVEGFKCDASASHLSVEASSDAEQDALAQPEVKLEPEDSFDVTGQFEMVTVPSTDQWKDGHPLDTNMMEPIATPESHMCRLCMKNVGKLPLFQPSGLPRVVAVQVMTVTRVKVSAEDGLPAHICTQCADTLHTFFNFKVQCEVADVTLRYKVATADMPQKVMCSDVYDKFSVLKRQMDRTLTKLNYLVAALKNLKDHHISHNLQPATAPFERVDVSMEESPLSPSSTSEVTFKTDIEIDEHMPEFKQVKLGSELCDNKTEVCNMQPSLQGTRTDHQSLPVSEAARTQNLPHVQAIPRTQVLPQVGDVPVLQMLPQTVVEAGKLLTTQMLSQPGTPTRTQTLRTLLEAKENSRITKPQLLQSGELCTSPVFLQSDELSKSQILARKEGLATTQVTEMFLSGGQPPRPHTFITGSQFPSPQMLVHLSGVPRRQTSVQSGDVPRTNTLVVAGELLDADGTDEPTVHKTDIGFEPVNSP